MKRQGFLPYRLPASTLERVVRIVFIAIVNGLLAMLICDLAGGNLFASKVDNGHYYFVSNGERVEISRLVFVYSRVHYTSLYASLVVMFLLGIPLGIVHVLQWLNEQEPKSL